MGIIHNGLVIFFFILLYFSTVSASRTKWVSALVQEKGMESRRQNQELLIRTESSALINAVIKRGGHGGHGGHGRGRGGGTNDENGGSTRTPGGGALIPLYGAGSGNKHNNHHSGASCPKHSQVGFSRLGAGMVVIVLLQILWF